MYHFHCFLFIYFLYFCTRVQKSITTQILTYYKILNSFKFYTLFIPNVQKHPFLLKETFLLQETFKI